MYAASNYMHVQGCRSLGHNQLGNPSLQRPAPLRQLLPGHKGFVLNVAAHVLCGGSLRVARGGGAGGLEVSGVERVCAVSLGFCGAGALRPALADWLVPPAASPALSHAPHSARVAQATARWQGSD